MGLFFSKNYKSYDIPFGYSLTDNLQLKLRIPYIMRKIEINGKEYKASGIGDMLVGVDYFWKNITSFDTYTNIYTNIPTGKNDEQDDGVLVPLGKDSYNIQLTQRFYKNINDINISGLVGFKYYFTDNEFHFKGQKYEEDVGTKFFANLGINKDFIQKFNLGVKAVYLLNEDSYLKIDNSDPLDLQNGIKTLDLIFNVTYYDFKFCNIFFSVIYPAYTDYNDDIEDEPDRKTAVYLNVVKMF